MFVDGLADQSVLLPTFRQGRACWEKVIDASAGRFVRVQVPYEDTTLPGYLLRPDASGAARPTLVVTNGSDELAARPVRHSGAAEALSRGWNAFVFDGPGQQSMLFERGVPFRYDWEAVLTPVIDLLVDAARCGRLGADRVRREPGRLLDHPGGRVRAPHGRGGGRPGRGGRVREWIAHLPAALLDLLDSGQKDAFNAAMARAQASASPEAARTLAFRSQAVRQD